MTKARPRTSALLPPGESSSSTQRLRGALSLLQPGINVPHDEYSTDSLSNASATTLRESMVVSPLPDERIPRHVYTFWDRTIELPSIVASCMSMMRDYNPGWKVTVLHSGTDGFELPPSTAPAQRDFGNNDALMADWYRLAALYEYGGIWMDASVMTVHAAEHTWVDLTSDGVMGFYCEGTSAETPGPECMESFAFAAPPKNELVKAWFDELRSAISMGCSSYGSTISPEVLGNVELPRLCVYATFKQARSRLNQSKIKLRPVTGCQCETGLPVRLQSLSSPPTPLPPASSPPPPPHSPAGFGVSGFPRPPPPAPQCEDGAPQVCGPYHYMEGMEDFGDERALKRLLEGVFSASEQSLATTPMIKLPSAARTYMINHAQLWQNPSSYLGRRMLEALPSAPDPKLLPDYTPPWSFWWSSPWAYVSVTAPLAFCLGCFSMWLITHCRERIPAHREEHDPKSSLGMSLAPDPTIG